MLKRLILVAAIAALSGCDSPADQAERAQILVQVDAHLALKNRLRDPDSADITDTRIDATNRIVCGAFRARNGFGGMAYLQNYIWRAGAVTLRKDEGDQQFQKLWRSTCDPLPQPTTP